MKYPKLNAAHFSAHKNMTSSPLRGCSLSSERCTHYRSYKFSPSPPNFLVALGCTCTHRRLNTITYTHTSFLTTVIRLYTCFISMIASVHSRVKFKNLGQLFALKNGGSAYTRVSKFATSRRYGSKLSDLYRQWSIVDSCICTCW